MRTRHILVAILLGWATVIAARADEVVATTTTTTTTESVAVTTTRTRTSELYSANELEAKFFGTYASRDRQGDSANRFGGGAGLDYFFIRYVGIGADTYIEEWKWPYRVNGSAILRLPLKDTGLAIYGLGGGGREFKDVPQYTWHGGGGLEYRFCHHAGIFADIREVFPDKTAVYTLVRAGLSVKF